MRPPVCEVCDADADGGLVQFATTEREQAAWEALRDADGVGHPPGLGWLCARHVDAARDLASSSMGVAIERLRGASSGPASALPTRTTVTRSIEPITLDTLVARLRELAAGFATVLGVDVPEEHEEVRRTWHPMDGATAPDCPFSDAIARTDPDGPIVRAGERAWWNGDSLARAHETLAVRLPDGVARWSVSGHLPADGSSDRVGELLLSGDVPELLRDVFDRVFPVPHASEPH